MQFFRQWLLGVVACALLTGAAEQLSPEGMGRRLIHFTGGLLLIAAMLRPLAQLELPEAYGFAGSYREAVARLELELGDARERELRRGIAEELEAYIEDKAGQLGADVRAEVAMGEDGVLPERATLHGTYSEPLSALLASELGIAKEKQIWIEDG